MRDNISDMELEEQLRESLDQLDRIAPVYTPKPEWIQFMVEEGMRKRKQKWRKELAIFWFLSIAMVSVLLAILYGSPEVFLIIQAVSLFCLLPIWIITSKKRRVDVT